jgi:hydrogenase expression/formation protein HypE
LAERRTGKPNPSRLNALLHGRFGKPSSRLLVGPGPGLDAAVLDLGDGRVMAVAEDPIFPAARLPLDLMGRFTVHIGASDVAVTGVKPEFMTYTLLLPGSSPESEAELLVRSISDAAAELGITIAGGHTGWYDAVQVPIVGGVAVWGFAPKDRWISPGGARSGDVILMTKGPSIEATALLGVVYRERLEKEIPSHALETALSRVCEISVVEDALTAFAVGGIHAMHDATEGGVLGGLWEMHAASGLRLEADLDGAPVPEDIRAVSAALGFNPWEAISEGTLLAAADPGRVETVRRALSEKGIPSWVIGRFDAGLKTNRLIRNGAVTDLPEPGQDPFWELFFAGLSKA